MPSINRPPLFSQQLAADEALMEDAIEAMFLLQTLLAANRGVLTEEGERTFNVLSDAETLYYLGVTVNEEEVRAAIEATQSRPGALYRIRDPQVVTAEAARSQERADTNTYIGGFDNDEDYIGYASSEEETNVTAMSAHGSSSEEEFEYAHEPGYRLDADGDPIVETHHSHSEHGFSSEEDYANEPGYRLDADGDPIVETHHSQRMPRPFIFIDR